MGTPGAGSHAGRVEAAIGNRAPIQSEPNVLPRRRHHDWPRPGLRRAVAQLAEDVSAPGAEDTGPRQRQDVPGAGGESDAAGERWGLPGALHVDREPLGTPVILPELPFAVQTPADDAAVLELGEGASSAARDRSDVPQHAGSADAEDGRGNCALDRPRTAAELAEAVAAPRHHAAVLK